MFSRHTRQMNYNVANNITGFAVDDHHHTPRCIIFCNIADDTLLRDNVNIYIDGGTLKPRWSKNANGNKNKPPPTQYYAMLHHYGGRESADVGTVITNERSTICDRNII